MQDIGMVSKYGLKKVLICAFLLTIAVIFDFFVPFFCTIFLFCIFIFRNPERAFPNDDNYAIFSPIDGKIENIEKTEFLNNEFVGITISNAIFNVGTLRAPCDIDLVDLKQRHGLFLDHKNFLNEQTTFVCNTKHKTQIIIQVISGIYSKQLYFDKFKSLKAGMRFGFLFNGSVVLMLPISTRISVSVGEKVKALGVLGFLDYEVKNDK